jgi:hypothetical protein
MMRDSKTQPDRACWRTRREAPRRRFPPPWSVEETDARFIVRDANGQGGSLSVTTRIAVWVARVFCLRWRYSLGCYSPGSLRYLE